MDKNYIFCGTHNSSLTFYH